MYDFNPHIICRYNFNTRCTFLILIIFQNAGYSEAYTTPFQYGAQVRDSNAYKVHHYIDQQKLARFEHAYQTAYPRIDIDLKYFKILCEDSDDINLGDINGQSVLHALCLYGSVNAVKIAVDAGGDVHQEDCHGYSVAHYCAIADRVDLLGYVYDGHGVSLSKKCVKSGRTPVHVACICDSLEVVKELVSRGVDYKVLDSNGYSAMWLAMYYHNNDISEYLFQQGGEGANCNVDMVSFLFRALDKCQGLGSKILDSFITECKYRDVTCIWLNKMVDDNSYLKADLTYPYLYVSNISDKFIEHTFIKTFISVGWRKFGRKAAAVEIALSLVYCLLWTLFYMIDDGKSMKGNAFRICVYIVLILYVAFMIFWSIRRLRVKSQANQSLILSETGIILSELSCLHPCMFEASYVLANEKRAILSKKTTVTSLLLLGHQLVDATVHVLSLIILILDFIKIFNKVDSTLYDNMIGEPTLSDRPGAKYRVNERSGPGGSYNIQEVYLIVSAVVLILVWITSFNKIRLLRRFGSFLILIINVGTLLAKFACFYVFLYIPIACVFWKTIYQYSNESSSLNITSLQSFYRVYRMTFSDYSYDDGLEIATSIGMPSWWDILVFYWITVGGLILLNILGGLVFAALTQPLEKSRIIAQKERLWFLCEVVMLQSGKEKAGFARYLDLECNPCVVARSAGGVRDVESEVKQLRTELEAIRDKFSDDNEPSSSSSFKYDPCI